MKRNRENILLLIFCTILVLSPHGSAGETELVLREPGNNAIVDSDTPILTWSDSGKKIYEVTIWGKNGAFVVHQTFVESCLFTVPKDVLEEGSTYLWAVKGREELNGPAGTESNRWEFSVKYRAGVEKLPEFAKTGNTLVVPVAFSDKDFSSIDPLQEIQDFLNPWDTNRGKLRDVIDRKMAGLKDYFEIASGNSSDVKQTTYDVAPVVKLKNPRKHYADDKLKPGKYFWHALSKQNWRIDCGDFPGNREGFAKLMQETLKDLFKLGIPVTEYYHIIYLVPGSGGNMPGSNQVWPATYGPSPRSRIKYRELDGEVIGYKSGIIMGIKNNSGTFCHEFGHEFGLPDLYPYPSHPKRNLKSACLMAAGNQKGEYGTGLVTLNKMKTFSNRGPEYKKEDWIENRFEVMSDSGTRIIYPRDSQAELVGIAVPTGQDDYKYYIVECFDRKGLDESIPAMLTPGQALASLNPFNSPGLFKCRAGVIIYKVDSLDVKELKKAKLIGLTGATQDSLVNRIPLLNKVFLDGGKIKNGLATIEIEKMEKDGDRYRARVKVTLK